MRHLLVAAGLALAACGTTTSTTTAPVPTTAATVPPTTATTTTVPSVPVGYLLHGSDELGFEVAVPEDWFIADLTSSDVNAIADELAADNPDLAELLRTATSSNDFQFLFWAFDLNDSGDGFTTNLNVTAFPRGPLDEPEVYEEALADQFESIGGELLVTERIDDSTLYVEMRLPIVNAAGDQVTSDGFQLFSFGDTQVINVSLSTDTPASYADAIAVMRNSFGLR